MKVTQVVFDSKRIQKQYPYHYRIEISHSRDIQKEVIEWAHETGFKCSVLPGAVYVVDKKSVAWFLLRWS